MKFSEVAQQFDRIEQESSRLIITQLLAELFKKASPQDAATLSYMSLGELNPVYIGTQFNIAQKSMTNVLASLLGEAAETITRHEKKLGDLGLVAAEGTWKCTAERDLTVNMVHEALVRIHNVSGEGSVEQKAKELEALLRQLDPLSAKYIVRIIIGKLRLGFSDMTILDALSWMMEGDKSLRPELENAYNVTADIGLIARTLKQEGIGAIKHMKVVPGVPIRPAAAERLQDAHAIVEKLGHCLAQPKLDGFRVQVHIYEEHHQKKIAFFSRNLQNMSEMFPELAHEARELEVTSLIAEGEAIAYDQETGTFLPFQETVKRKRKHDIESIAQEFPLKLFLFDLLYLNGVSYLDKTHEERRAALLELLAHQKHAHLKYIQGIDEKKINTAQELERYFNETITQGLEGLVVKKPNAPYTPGKRNFNWVKLKRHESGHVDDTLDCVVLGYYAGLGKRAHFGIGAFLIGVYNAKTDMFETIAKVGTGLSDEEWKAIKKQCDGLASSMQPKNVVCSKELRPDVWITPEMVVAIRADEITLSPLHSAGATKATLGYALRFPRFVGYRPDKSAAEATTVREIEELYRLQFKEKGVSRR